MNIKKYKSLLLSVCCVAALSGCGGDTAVPDQTADTAVTDIRDEGEKSSDKETVPANVGTFTTTDIDGKAYDQSIFAESDLTLVNVFATSCNPCVAEMPELQRVQDELGVPVVAIVIDGVDEKLDPVESVLEDAKYLREQTNITFPMLLPDKTGLNGYLFNVSAVPETFFVDKEGNIIGEPYVGGRNFDQWKKVIEEDLKK